MKIHGTMISGISWTGLAVLEDCSDGIQREMLVFDSRVDYYEKRTWDECYFAKSAFEKLQLCNEPCFVIINLGFTLAFNFLCPISFE